MRAVVPFFSCFHWSNLSYIFLLIITFPRFSERISIHISAIFHKSKFTPFLDFYKIIRKIIVPHCEKPTNIFADKGLKTIVYMPEKQEPELMYKLFDGVVGNIDDLIRSI